MTAVLGLVSTILGLFLMALPVLGSARLRHWQADVEHAQSRLSRHAEEVRQLLSTVVKSGSASPKYITSMIAPYYWFIATRLLWKVQGWLLWIRRQPEDVRRPLLLGLSAPGLMPRLVRLALWKAADMTFGRRLRWFLIWVYLVFPGVVLFDVLAEVTRPLVFGYAALLGAAVSFLSGIERRGVQWLVVLMGFIVSVGGAVMHFLRQEHHWP
jgi:hypothetical protein